MVGKGHSEQNSYLNGVILVICPLCKAQPRDKCKGQIGPSKIAHRVRIKAAGYKWNRAEYRLEKL